MSDHNKETEARCPHCYRHYVEGTAAWALYMMRMGHKVTNPKYDPRVYHLPEGDMIHVNGIKSIATNQWIDYWCIDLPDGWQLYEEPQPEPAFKVGDWVEIEVAGVISQQRVRTGVFSDRINAGGFEFYSNGLPVMKPLNARITRKLDPTEVVIHIGCLSGTVEKAQDYAYFLLWHNKTDCDYSMIKWSAIDTPTRELVESLLDAQDEK